MGINTDYFQCFFLSIICWVDPSKWTHLAISQYSQCSTTGVRTVVSVHKKVPLLLIGKSSPWRASSRFPRGRLPYVWPHIAIIKMLLNTQFPSLISHVCCFRTLFSELRMTIEHLCNKPQCPQIVRNIAYKGISLLSRLAPAINPPQ